MRGKIPGIWFVNIILILLACGSIIKPDTRIKKVAELPVFLNESSGLISTTNGLYTLNDNNEPEFYRIDTATGEILQTIVVDGVAFKDKEALTFDGGAFFIGDFGNNDGDRRDLKIVIAKVKAGPEEEKIIVEGEIINFYYPEQKSFNIKKKENAFDCEAMVVYNDSIYLFTKQRNDHKTTIYALPARPGSFAAKKLSDFNVRGRISDAAISPDNKTLLLLGYQDDHLFPFLWRFTEFENSQFFNGRSSYKVISESPLEWQTEGITFFNGQEIFISSETTSDGKASLFRGGINEIF